MYQQAESLTPGPRVPVRHMVETYHVAFVIFGLAIFAAVVLPRLLMHRPMSLPIIYVGAGFLLFAFPHGVEPPNMVESSVVVEHLTEQVVTVALMGAGLKIDRPFSWRDGGRRGDSWGSRCRSPSPPRCFSAGGSSGYTSRRRCSSAR